MKRIDAKTLHAWIADGQELALLDAREDGEFGASHLFWAVPCGLARKEIRARALLPRLAVRICCVDDGRGLAETLAAWLEGDRLHRRRGAGWRHQGLGRPPAMCCSAASTCRPRRSASGWSTITARKASIRRS